MFRPEELFSDYGEVILAKSPKSDEFTTVYHGVHSSFTNYLFEYGIYGYIGAPIFWGRPLTKRLAGTAINTVFAFNVPRKNISSIYRRKELGLSPATAVSSINRALIVEMRREASISGNKELMPIIQHFTRMNRMNMGEIGHLSSEYINLKESLRASLLYHVSPGIGETFKDPTERINPIFMEMVLPVFRDFIT
jgi:hypothetical protein